MGGEDDTGRDRVRPCTAADGPEMLEVINAAAQAYRGVIPPDRWREPYMLGEELASEIADGVVFSGCEVDGALVGVMGVQRRWNVDLIRHGFARAPDEAVAPLLRTYWHVPERQVATSLVLSSPALDAGGAERLITEALARI